MPLIRSTSDLDPQSALYHHYQELCRAITFFKPQSYSAIQAFDFKIKVHTFEKNANIYQENQKVHYLENKGIVFKA